MSDEITPTEVPEEKPDPIAEREAAVAKREAELKEWETKNQRLASELGQLRSEVAKMQQSKKSDDDDVPDLDDASTKAVFKAFEKRLGVPVDELVKGYQAATAVIADELDAVDSDFFSKHTDVERSTVYEKAVELGLLYEGITPSKARKALDVAYAVVAPKKDADMESLIAARVEEELKKRVKPGEEVLAVTPKGGKPSEGGRNIVDAIESGESNFFDAMEMFSTK